MRFKKIILLGIIILAFILRFYRLSDYPALNADEAAIGYNAYSLLQTGHDEHGNAWPIHFQSFNDFKPGLYFYMVLPFVKVLGLNEWAVRIPNALLGVATVFTLYFLVKELFKDKKLSFNVDNLALSASFLLSISPWHIQFSRGGWEVNVATFFITLGLWLFLKGLNNFKYLALCALAFVLSLYTYHAARVVVPLLMVGLLFVYHRQIRPNLKMFAISVAIALFLLLPLGADLAKGEVFSRAAGVGLFADPGPLSRVNEQRGEHQSYGSLAAKFFHNKPVNYSLAFLQNWSQHYWGEFLFLTGDVIQRNRVPETGQMYLFDLLFLIVGFMVIARNCSREWGLIIFWLVVSPFAAALTFQSPHALRAQNMVISLTLISAFGLVNIVSLIKNNVKNKYLFFSSVLILSSIIVWNFARYEHMYWVHMSKEFPYSSQYGVKELVNYVEREQENYEKVIVTDRYDQPYILFLFYLKYPPQLFQNEHNLSERDIFGFSTVRSFGKFEFRPINFDIDQPNNPKSLIAGTDEEIPDESNIVKEIYGTNGYKYFEVVAN